MSFEGLIVHFFLVLNNILLASLVAQWKESSCLCRRCGFDNGLGKSPGEGNGNPLQYSCLGNPINRGAWQAIVHGATRESDST